MILISSAVNFFFRRVKGHEIIHMYFLFTGFVTMRTTLFLILALGIGYISTSNEYPDSKCENIFKFLNKIKKQKINIWTRKSM